jgi:hypothetical protein
MKISIGDGAYIEPDEGPRNTPFHKRILQVTPLPNTLSGTTLDLECGHRVMGFGNLGHTGGVTLCLQCRDTAEEAEMAKRVAAKAFIEVCAGVIPGIVIDGYTKCWSYTSQDYEQDKTTPQDQPTIFSQRLQEAHDYALGLSNPTYVNWVRVDWTWV